MGFLGALRKAISMLWAKKAQDVFKIKIQEFGTVDALANRCVSAYKGAPDWLDDPNGIRTVNVAQTVCAEIARLATMNVETTVTGGGREKLLQDQLDSVKKDFRKWVEYACGYGEAIIRPNGVGVEIVLPDEYIITEEVGSEIRGVIFMDKYYDSREKKYYTRLEYHRFEGEQYLVTNRCYVGEHEYDMSQEIPIELTIWRELQPETIIENVDHLLFGFLRMPGVNNVNPHSNRALPVFAGAIEEMRDFDMAYSLNAIEISDSRRTVLLDSDRLMVGGKRNISSPFERKRRVEEMGLPKYVKTIEGTGSGDIYHEINPTLQTETRIAGMNNLLSQIGFKCGFSNGYFVFNEKSGMVTATQVESDDRRTLQLITDIRESLKVCIDGLVAALNAFADASGISGGGEYEIAYDFADLTLSETEDKMRWLSFVQAGYIPFWRYLVMFEGYTEEEAKEISIQTEPQDVGLFGDVNA